MYRLYQTEEKTSVHNSYHREAGADRFDEKYRNGAGYLIIDLERSQRKRTVISHHFKYLSP